METKQQQCINERLKRTTPVEGSVCAFAQTTHDYEGLARVLSNQSRRTPIHTELITRMALREAMVGKTGFFFTKTSGAQPHSRDKEKGESVGGYVCYTTAEEMGCSGFLFFPNGKWQPVFLEEIEVQMTPTEESSRSLDYIRSQIGTFFEMQAAISTSTFSIL